MDKITKEQIYNVIEKIMNKIDINNEYAKSITRFEKVLNEAENKKIPGDSLYLATLSTAIGVTIGVSVRIIGEALYELLCDEVVE